MEIQTKECPSCGKIIASIYPTQLAWNFEMHVKSCKAKGKKEVVAEKNLSAIAKTSTESAHQTKARKINEEIRK